MPHEPIRHPIRRAVGLAGALTAAFLGAVAAGPPASATAESAIIRGGHFSPDTPGVDVYLTAFDGGTKKLWLSGVGYGDVSAYQRFAPGVYAVAMRPHGAAPSTPAALTWTLDARPGAAYTACAVGMNKQLRGVVLHDSLALPPAGHARVRVIQAASRAQKARVVLRGGPTVGAAIPFASTSGYVSVPAGRHVVDVTSEGSSLRAAATETFAADSVHTIVVLDTKGGGLTVRTLDDAAGAATPPAGAAPAGGGGTAPAPHRNWEPLGILAAALLAVGALTAVRVSSAR